MTQNREPLDLRGREYAMLIPLLILMVWMGVYSNSFPASHGRIGSETDESGRKPAASNMRERGIRNEPRHNQYLRNSSGIDSSVFGIAVMVAEPFVAERRNRRWAGWRSQARSSQCSVFPQWPANRGQWYSNLWIVDDYSIFFSFVFLLIARNHHSDLA